LRQAFAPDKRGGLDDAGVLQLSELGVGDRAALLVLDGVEPVHANHLTTIRVPQIRSCSPRRSGLSKAVK
jgi:hypothetical protein